MTAIGTGVGADEPRRRLHPLSPLLRSTRLIAVAVAAISWQGYAQLGLQRWVVVMALVLVGAIAASVVSWWFTGYQVVGRELRIHEGLLWRRTRAIPLERLQAVDVVRPLMARAAGLAELRLEVVGASKAEAPLAYLTMREASALRDRLLRLSAGVAREAEPARAAPEEAAPGEAAPVPPDERPVHAVNNQDVLVGQLLTPQVWFLPFGVTFVIIQFVTSPEWTFIGVASLVTAAVGVLYQPFRRVLDDWHFTVAIGPDGLRLRHGLLETRSQTLPPRRVQAIGATWPLLWRMKGWLRLRIDVAGYGAGREGAVQAGHLLPVGDLATARRIVPEVLPGVDLAAVPLAPPPARATWLAPLRRRVLGAALTGEVFAASDGLVTRQLVVVPYARIQSVRVVQGPLQRRLRLATVHADTAGALHAQAPHRDLAEAWSMAAALAERARAARALASSSDPEEVATDSSDPGGRCA